MRYSIIIESEAENDLQNILVYIRDNDSLGKAKNFIGKLKNSIETLTFMPHRCRDSIYIKDNKTKDLIYNGYTICYYINPKHVHIVAVFRQR